ncbi:MAG: permease-like cell division protein FtsX [Gammaproteobacteria bacterium]|nr:permease-like cell division protein FtsX [Gammaproteobacteria bacterium]
MARESFVELMDSWVSSLMTWLVIGIALALPTLLYLLLENVGDISGDWQGKPKVSVYLHETVSVAEGREITADIAARSDVESATFISAAQALAEFQSFSGFGDVLDSLDDNPLPPLVEVVPAATEPGALRMFVANLEGGASVDRVSIDLEWVERLYALLALGERFVLALGLFLALGVLLSIGNTIRLAIENRRAEIEVVKLVGGTDSFVRRPFLYLGFWYGFGGALAAWVMVQVSLMFLSGPVDRLLRSYEDEFDLAGLGVAATLVLVGTGGLLGILGAALAVRRHLHLIEPQ